MSLYMSKEKKPDDRPESDGLLRCEGDMLYNYRDVVIKQAMDKLWDGDFLQTAREDDFAMRRRQLKRAGHTTVFEAEIECVNPFVDFNDINRESLERIMRVRVEEAQPEKIRKQIIESYIIREEGYEQVTTELEDDFENCTALIVTEYEFFFDGNVSDRPMEKESSIKLVDEYSDVVYDSSYDDDDCEWEERYDALDEEIEKMEFQIGAGLSRDDIDRIEACFDVLGLS